MTLHRGRQARDRRKARQFRLERLTSQVGRLHALIEANPQEPRFSSQGGQGSKGDHSDPTYRAAVTPDPIEGMLTRADERIELAVQLLEDAARDIRAVETVGQQEPRINSVPVCCVCEGPCVPRARSRDSHGPLCPACYGSWLAGGRTWAEWLPGRQERLAEERDRPRRHEQDTDQHAVLVDQIARGLD